MTAGLLAPHEPQPDVAARFELLPIPQGNEFRRWLRSVRRTDTHRGLAAHPLFAHCSRSEIRTMVRFGDAVQVQAGETLLREDTIGSCFLAVLSGTIVLTRKGQEVGEIGAGAHVGDIAILGFGPQPATATAVTPAVVFVLGSRAFLSLAQDVAGLRRGLFPGLSRAEVLQRVRELRQKGLPAWRTLRPTRRPCSRPRTIPPASRPSATLALATEPFVGRSRPTPAVLTPPARPNRRRTVAIGAAVVTLLALLVLILLPLPYYSLKGELRSATRLTTVHDARVYPPRGEVLFPIIVSQHDTGIDVLRDLFDHDIDVLTAQELYGNGNSADIDHRNVELMTVAKVAAEALIEKTASVDDLYVTIDTGDLGGPSGGLAFALTLLDVLTPGELTNGQRVAATGTISPDGTVGPVSGIRQKTMAVRRAGVEIFLVPRAEYDEVLALAGDVRVVPVDTFDDAVNALQAA